MERRNWELVFGTNLQFYKTENDQDGCWSCTPLWVNLIKSNWRLKRILHNLKDQKKKIRKIWSWSTAEWDGLSTSSKQKAWETDLIWFKKKKSKRNKTTFLSYQICVIGLRLVKIWILVAILIFYPSLPRPLPHACSHPHHYHPPLYEIGSLTELGAHDWLE